MSDRDREDGADGLEPIEDLEVVEELEPIGELEGVEAGPADGIGEGGEPRTRAAESPLLASSFLRDLARSYEKTLAPLAILDRDLGFVYQNPTFRQLARDFRYSGSGGFPSIFSRCIPSEEARNLKDSILEHDGSHSWKGVLYHRVQDAPAKITRAMVQPLWPVEEGLRAPNAYTLALDDVTDEKRHDLRSLFTSLLEASKLKDYDTGNHVERVNLYSALLAKSLFGDERWPEVDVDFMEDVSFLAAMHDVGKIGTPDRILTKKGPLNDEEWQTMKEHTINGAILLSSYPNPMARDIAKSHHEWWNGSGYPYGFQGPMIPLAARIVSIADVYDALRMKRSYKPSYDHATAVEKIAEDAGLHFDPDLVEVFRTLDEGFEEIFERNADASAKGS